ncbi:MAG: enoyl-CoA hydratase-related protein [Pseudomonadota bacterium]
MDEVLYETSDGIAIITINRPEQRNAVNTAVREGLRAAWHRFEADPAARVAILTAAGNVAFSAGKDMKEPGGFDALTASRDFLPILGDNIHLSKPVIAAVNGYALAGGFVFAQMCDMCVASSHATFAITEVKLGRGVAWAVPLARMIPQKVLLELLLTGATISAQRAWEIGLVNHVVPADQLMPKAMDLARMVVAGAPLSVSAARQVVQVAAELGRSAALDRAYEIMKAVYESGDAQEGPRAFAEKRPPRWTGR